MPGSILHHDDVGAEVGEQPAGVRGGQRVTAFEDPQAVERGGGTRCQACPLDLARPAVASAICLARVEVVVLAGHDPLGVQPAAGLDVGDRLPAAVGVGGEVADGVEQPGAVLAVDVVARCDMYLRARCADLGVLEVGDRRRGDDRRRRRCRGGGAPSGCSWPRRCTCRRWCTARWGTPRRTAPVSAVATAPPRGRPARRVAWMIISEIFSLMCACAGEAVGLGDQLGAARRARRRRRPSPTARRGAPTGRASGRTPRRSATSPSRKMRSFGHEHVVEDDEALGVVVARRTPGSRACRRGGARTWC